jgi:glutamate formiminotransferase
VASSKVTPEISSPDLPDLDSTHPSHGWSDGRQGQKVSDCLNINLNTPDVTIAKRIAKTIRFSSGGLPFVKAMGVDLKARNQAQVSMNLTDFEQTPIHRVFEIVKREAEGLGVTIAGSEIVGLVPAEGAGAVG